jgi:hypothetical protein
LLKLQILHSADRYSIPGEEIFRDNWLSFMDLMSIYRAGGKLLRLITQGRETSDEKKRRAFERSFNYQGFVSYVTDQAYLTVFEMSSWAAQAQVLRERYSRHPFGTSGADL